ncbi:MAG: glycine cleavage system protein H [Candidatus Lernaella stagnicola]|nr:glycine cleavage system protein H [Candidatus Lernaella stagnicola]
MTEFHTFVDFVRDSKILEYGVAFLFMAAFAVFYRVLHKPQPQIAVARASVFDRALEQVKGILVPEDISFHPGHTWARPEGAMATVGMDDFAAKLVGRIDRVQLPEIGTELKQGEPAWTLYADGKAVEMLAPVSGKVVAINETAAKAAADDPFGAGWMMKIEAPSMATNLKNLLSGIVAKAWTEHAVDALFSRANQQLGAVAADGGAPISGMAKVIDVKAWDEIAKEYFLTK